MFFKCIPISISDFCVRIFLKILPKLCDVLAFNLGPIVPCVTRGLKVPGSSTISVPCICNRVGPTVVSYAPV